MPRKGHPILGPPGREKGEGAEFTYLLIFLNNYQYLSQWLAGFAKGSGGFKEMRKGLRNLHQAEIIFI